METTIAPQESLEVVVMTLDHSNFNRPVWRDMNAQTSYKRDQAYDPAGFKNTFFGRVGVNVNADC